MDSIAKSLIFYLLRIVVVYRNCGGFIECRF
jgi:hypothetical protein